MLSASGCEMHIALEDLPQTFRKRFHSPGTEPGQYAKDTGGALYASCRSSAGHSRGTCRPPQLSSAPSVHRCGLTQVYAHGL